MKVAAKQVLVDTANKNGIPWKQTVKKLQSTPEVQRLSAMPCQKPPGNKIIAPHPFVVKTQSCKGNTALPQVYALKDVVENEAVAYPEYYLQPFHAYPKGNLDWLPAFEVESATMSMAVRTFPGTEPAAAQQRLRSNIHAAIKVLSPSLWESSAHVHGATN